MSQIARQVIASSSSAVVCWTGAGGGVTSALTERAGAISASEAEWREAAPAGVPPDSPLAWRASPPGAPARGTRLTGGPSGASKPA
eukprot:2446471-Alexandrium_andersonii.AAC.1